MPIETPWAWNVSPLPAVIVRSDPNSRVWVDAATVVTQLDRCPAVEAPGPSLPAEVATNTPAA